MPRTPSTPDFAPRLQLPTTVDTRKVRWPYLTSVVVVHALALLAFWPALFRWSSVIAAAAGVYVFGTLGINLCYHRLLTHRGFKCGKRLEHFFALLGVCCLQETPAHWVAVHRMHHQHSDEQPDPHSPLVNFFWSHLGWLWIENSELERFGLFERYAKDLVADRFYRRLERNFAWVWVNLVQWGIFFLAGAAIGWLPAHSIRDAAMAGLSMLVWAVFVRTVIVWHITWSVNSVTHLWGYRNYDTRESSRNNWIVGLLSNGEGWHNNHHAQPRAASHGHRWWELDVTFLTIRALATLGIASDVVLPVPATAEKKPAPAPAPS
ncbi:MAG TPA: fatty acid desaturase, partial [Chthoniobacteraceae bacterium]|nr:fatty acid desaturase [Chthoniobacteraceae bacterium]